MTDPVRPGPASPVLIALQRGAQASGSNFDLLLATAQRESSLNPNARAGTSSASGLFQFIESTWLDMVRRHGADHGLGAYANQIDVRGGRSHVADPAMRREILALRFDPELSARMAGELSRENAAFLESRLGRPASAGELYAAHVMGPAGASRLIAAANDGAPSAAALFPREAAANRHLFYTRDGTARSAAQLLERLNLNLGAAGEPMAAVPPAPVQAPVSPSIPLVAPGFQMVSSTTTQALIDLATGPWESVSRLLLEPERREDEA